MLTLPTWRNPGHLVGALLFAMIVSCGGSPQSSNPVGNIQVTSSATVAMDHLFIAPSSGSTWGADQLAGQSVATADSITLTQITPGNYDVQAWFADGSGDEVFSVPVLQGQTAPVTLSNSGNGTLAVFNDSADTIDGIYLTPSSTVTWGPNQVDQPVTAGQTMTLTGVAPGTYDVRVVFAGGGPLDTLGVIFTPDSVSTVQIN